MMDPTLDEVIEKLEWMRKQHGGNVAVPFATDIYYVLNGGLPEILLGHERRIRDEIIQELDDSKKRECFRSPTDSIG